MNGTINLSPHENILTIALINIHYLHNSTQHFLKIMQPAHISTIKNNAICIVQILNYQLTQKGQVMLKTTFYYILTSFLKHLICEKVLGLDIYNQTFF